MCKVFFIRITETLIGNEIEESIRNGAAHDKNTSYTVTIK